MNGQATWNRTQALLRDGQKQQARSVAHAEMDAEPVPGVGTAAAAAVAIAEGFDALAERLLQRLQLVEEVEGTRMLQAVVTMRRGTPAIDALANLRRGDVVGLPAIDVQHLVAVAADCARISELRELVTWQKAHHGPSTHAPWALTQDALAALDMLGRLVPLNRNHQTMRTVDSDGPRALVVASLPPYRGTSDGTLQRFAEGFLGRARGARAESFWRRWRDALAPGVDPQIRLLHAASGNVPMLTEEAVVVLADGVLSRFTAPHWAEALDRWGLVFIAGLEVRDPSALNKVVVQGLRRHGPIGVRDAASRWLLLEHGVEAFESGTCLPPGPGVKRQAHNMWNDVAEGVSPHIRPAMIRIVRESLNRGSMFVRGAWRDLAGSNTGNAASSTWTLPPGPECNGIAAAVRSEKWPSAASVGSAPLIDVVLAVDSQLAHALPVAIESCLSRSSRPIRFHVLTRGLGCADWSNWMRLFEGRAELNFYPFDGASFGDDLHLIGHTTVSTLDRLLLPLLLENLNRVIYLDVDLVVLGDLAELWDLDLGAHPLAAKPSSSPGTQWGIQMLYHALGALPIEQARPIRRWLHETGPMAFRAFNAGVLVMDLAKMRQDNATSYLTALVEHCAMNDQDALNTYTRGNYLQLDGAWNAAPRQDDTQGAKIIHFVGPVKPWHELYISRKYEYERVRARVEQRRRELGLE